MRKIILFSALALLVFATVGCDKNKEEKERLPNAKIIKVLPNQIFSGVDCIYGKMGEILIINSQEKLNKIYKNANIPKKLENINFDKETLVIGSCNSTNGVEKVEHQFIKEGDKYKYILTVYQNYTDQVVHLKFATIVEKIPNNSEVIFIANLKL